jgi:hypothetical protein
MGINGIHFILGFGIVSGGASPSPTINLLFTFGIV